MFQFNTLYKLQSLAFRICSAACVSAFRDHTYEIEDNIASIYRLLRVRKITRLKQSWIFSNPTFGVAVWNSHRRGAQRELYAGQTQTYQRL